MPVLALFVAGQYTSSYAVNGNSGKSLGLTKEGFRLRFQFATDNIEQTDGYARTCIEQFFEGMNMWVGGIFMQWSTSTIIPLNAVTPYNLMPYGGASTGTMGPGVISQAASATGGALILSALAGTPAFTASAPLSITAPLAIQDGGFNVEMLFGPTHREIPFLFRVIPVNVSTTPTFLSIA